VKGEHHLGERAERGLRVIPGGRELVEDLVEREPAIDSVSFDVSLETESS
jgi:hypothetical protein